jgi:hypothetical protein
MSNPGCAPAFGNEAIFLVTQLHAETVTPEAGYGHVDFTIVLMTGYPDEMKTMDKAGIPYLETTARTQDASLRIAQRFADLATERGGGWIR